MTTRGVFTSPASMASLRPKSDTIQPINPTSVLALPVEEPGLVAQAVYDEVFRAVCPVGYDWCRQKAVDPASLFDAPLLMLGPGNCFRDQVLDLCGSASRDAGHSPQAHRHAECECDHLRQDTDT